MKLSNTVPELIWRLHDIWRSVATDCRQRPQHYAPQHLLTPLCDFTGPTRFLPTFWLLSLNTFWTQVVKMNFFQRMSGSPSEAGWRAWSFRRNSEKSCSSSTSKGTSWRGSCLLPPLWWGQVLPGDSSWLMLMLNIQDLRERESIVVLCFLLKRRSKYLGYFFWTNLFNHLESINLELL